MLIPSNARATAVNFKQADRSRGHRRRSGLGVDEQPAKLPAKFRSSLFGDRGRSSVDGDGSCRISVRLVRRVI